MDLQTRLNSISLAKDFISSSHLQSIERMEDYYSGRHTPHLKSLIQKLYPKAYADGQMLLYPLPVVKRLVDTTATLFHRPPSYEARKKYISSPLSIADHDMEMWLEIDRQSDWNSQLKMANRMARRQKVCLVGPAWRGGKICIDVIRPSLFWVLEDPKAPGDIDQAQLVLVSTESGYVAWTQESVVHLVPSRQGAYQLGDAQYDPAIVFPQVSTSEKDEYANPYGIIPFVLFFDQPCSGIDQHLDDTLLSAQETISCLHTFWNWLVSRGSFMNIAKIINRDAFRDQQGGPDRILAVDPDEDIVRIAAPIDYAGMIAYGQYLLKTLATMQSADPTIFNADTSGFANSLSAAKAQIDRLDLNEFREDQESDWKYSLVRLIKKTCVVWNKHVETGKQISEDLVWTVNFVEPATEQNALQLAQSEQIRLDNGTATKAQLIAERQGISVAEAQQLVDEAEKNGTRVQDPERQGMEEPAAG